MQKWKEETGASNLLEANCVSIILFFSSFFLFSFLFFSFLFFFFFLRPPVPSRIPNFFFPFDSADNADANDLTYRGGNGQKKFNEFGGLSARAYLSIYIYTFEKYVSRISQRRKKETNRFIRFGFLRTGETGHRWRWTSRRRASIE